MERFREYYYFWLGARIARVDSLKSGMTKTEVMVVLYPAWQALTMQASDNFASLPMCASAGSALMNVVDAFSKGPQGELGEKWRLTELEFTKIREAARAFDIALSIQLDHIDTYRVMPKGTHDTRKLIEHPEMRFGSLWGHLCDLTRDDWTSASRCLAFDLPTACGFHCLRAMEAAVIQYLTARGEPPPKRNLGEYINSLKKLSADDAAVSIVDHLRAHHRNPLMHPQDTLDIQEALTVFDLSAGAVTCLVNDMLAKGMPTR